MEFTFGDYRLDPDEGYLYRGAAVVPLTPKAFTLLCRLVESAGRLVSKKDLLDAAWPGVFVGDAVLKVTIRELRKSLGDNPQAPRFIETAHRRGYRFVAPVTSRAQTDQPLAGSASVAAVVPVSVAAIPRVSYARSGGVNIAYQVVGSGPLDIVFVMGWVSHLEYFWREPSFARFLTGLAAQGRVILFDKRGTGLSDPVPINGLPTLEQRMDDVRAVMDAVGSERAVLLGVSEGGPLCSLFAATYPEKTEALVMIGCYARRLRDDDYPWGPTRAERDEFCRRLVDAWGGPVGIEERAPSRAAEPEFREWWASYLRMGASPGAAVALTRMNADIDIRDILPSISVPTLVLHRAGDRCLRVEEGRYLASRIPGASFVELPGEDHLPFVGDQGQILSEIARFLSRTRVRRGTEHVLSTVLTVASEAAPAEVAQLERVFAREVSWHRGQTLRTSGRLLVATFDGPGRAVQCACAITSGAERSRADVRAGVHLGECDVGAEHGPVFETSAAITAAAHPGEVLVSRTVVDLVAGSGLRFVDRGLRLKAGSRPGLPLFAARMDRSEDEVPAASSRE